MKYLIMMFGGLGAAVEHRSPEWITGMHRLLMDLDRELRDKGELVAGDALVDPARATTVRFINGAAVPTDGPFAEIKESLAGYWLIEAGHERSVEVASQVVAYTEYPMEVRQLRDQPAEP